MSGDERCFKCNAFLGDLPPEELEPVRKKDSNINESLAYRLKKFFRRSYFEAAKDEFPAERFQGAYRRFYPFIAAFASFMLPGLGQIINRRPLKGLFFFLAYFGLLVYYYISWFHGLHVNVDTFPVFLYCLSMSPVVVSVVHVWVIFDAYSEAYRKSQNKPIGIGEAIVVSFMFSILIFLLLSTFRDISDPNLEAFRMGPMQHLVHAGIFPGDTVIINSHYYERHLVKRGQIVRYSYSGMVYVGRRLPGRGAGRQIMQSVSFIGEITGMPGEHVVIDKDGIHAGGKNFPLPYGWKEFITDEHKIYKCRLGLDAYFIMFPFESAPWSLLKGDMAPCIVHETLIKGKCIMVFNPPGHRKVLP